MASQWYENHFYRAGYPSCMFKCDSFQSAWRLLFTVVRAWGCLHCMLISHSPAEEGTRLQGISLLYKLKPCAARLKRVTPGWGQLGNQFQLLSSLGKGSQKEGQLFGAHTWDQLRTHFFIFHFFIFYFPIFFLFRVRLRPTHPLPNNYWIFGIFLIGQDP